MKILLCLLLFSSIVFAEENTMDFDFGVKAGLIYGGPIPTIFLENLTFTPLLGPHFGVYCNYKVNDRITLQPEISISLKGANYDTFYRRDTIVETEIDGVTGLVPTFYTAMIKGDMALFYIDIPVFLNYKISEKFDLSAAAQISYLIGGKNDINARVIVGEGGFYDDLKKYYDNYGFLNSLDFAFCLGASYLLSERFSITAYGTRAITPLYKDSFKTDKELDAGKMYHTDFILALVYRF
ncbi:MAG: porin family protein [bacterium]